MRTVVTGVAGFIGSRLASRLLERGDDVVGVDMFTPFYALDAKKANLEPFAEHGHRFAFHELDLRKAPLEPVTAGAEVVFHLAAQPGVRASWGEAFHDYTGHNIVATQRLLEASQITGVRRVVFASSSSVYGEAERHPTPEDVEARPISPYGVTKLAAEHLLRAYRAQFGLEFTALRYFTVYGPGQRPDMAFHRFIAAALEGRPIAVYGDGEQSRDVTFVDDAVQATMSAATADGVEGLALNVGGGSRVTINEAVEAISREVGHEIRVERGAAAPGDVRDTSADLSRARELLGYAPAVGFEEGLRREVAWLRERLPLYVGG
jgi:nucleoside-diphosphate-sugar epimerase